MRDDRLPFDEGDLPLLHGALHGTMGDPGRRSDQPRPRRVRQLSKREEAFKRPQLSGDAGDGARCSRRSRVASLTACVTGVALDSAPLPVDGDPWAKAISLSSS